MPAPTSGYQDPQLSTLSNIHRNRRYIAERIAPVLPVKKETGKVRGFSNDHLRTYNLTRAYGASSNRMAFELTDQANWNIEERDVEVAIDYREIDQYDAPYDAQRDATIMVTETMWLDLEVAFAAQLTATATITNNETLAGGDQWSDFVNSDPLSKIEDAIEAVRGKIGIRANKAYMGRAVFSKIKFHPDIVDRVKFVGSGSRDESAIERAIAELFDLEELIIGDNINVTSKKGQTNTKADVWGKDFGVFYQAPRATIMEPSFAWTPRISTGGRFRGQRSIDTREENGGKSTVVRCTDNFDVLIVDTDAAFLYKNAVN